MTVYTLNTSEDFQDALDLCDEVLWLAEKAPESANDFIDSVCEKVERIKDRIRLSQYVTDGQFQALMNMRRGIEKWL